MKLTKAALLGGVSHFGVQLGRDIWRGAWRRFTEPRKETRRHGR